MSLLERSPDRQLDQESGSKWSIYYDVNVPSDLVVLTGAGQELLESEKADELQKLIYLYRAAELGSKALLGPMSDMRVKLGEGNQAKVYSMGQYAVREEKGRKSDWKAVRDLERMAAINSVMEHGIPRWLHVPKHYAVHVDPTMSRSKTYTLMDKIDSGMTAADIANYPNVPEYKKKVVEAELSEHLEDAKAKVPDLSMEAFEILAKGIEADGKETDELLNDWAPRNILVERLRDPIAGKNYMLHVIDQHATD